MAHPRLDAGVDLPAWKAGFAFACAALLALLFIVSGGWKLTDPFGWSARLVQMRFPGFLSMPGTLAVGIAEVFAGLLILVPRFRRWGAILISALLVVFMIYVGLFYNELRGEECSCFPWIKRAVGPSFFAGDIAMLLAALAAWRWSRPSVNLKGALMTLGAVAVFAGASYGVAMTQNSGKQAPDTLTVDGKLTNIAGGKVFLYFYDPECAHCDEAARRMSKWNWKDTRVIGLPTRVPQFGAEFMATTGLKAPNSSDADLVKKTFPFGDPPYGVAIENGRQKASLQIFDKDQPEGDLRKLGFIQ